MVAVPDLLSYLGADAVSARARYLELVSDASEVPVASHPLVEGDDDFVKEHLARLHSSPEHPRASIRPRRPDLADLVSSRDDRPGIVGAYAGHGYSMCQIATHLRCGGPRFTGASGSTRRRPQPDPGNLGRLPLNLERRTDRSGGRNGEDLTVCRR